MDILIDSRCTIQTAFEISQVIRVIHLVILFSVANEVLLVSARIRNMTAALVGLLFQKLLERRDEMIKTAT